MFNVEHKQRQREATTTARPRPGTRKGLGSLEKNRFFLGVHRSAINIISQGTPPMSRSKKPPPPAPSQRQASRYDHRQAGKNAVARRVSAAGREVGEIPPVANVKRRADAEHDFRLFAETYLSATFSMPWSADHLRVIAKIEAAVLRGELFAFAMPRGSGKSSMVEAAALWAALYGHRDFIVVIGAAAMLAGSGGTEPNIVDANG